MKIDRKKEWAELQKAIKLGKEFEKTAKAYYAHLAKWQDKRGFKLLAQIGREPLSILAKMAREGDERAGEQFLDSIHGLIEQLTYTPDASGTFKKIARTRTHWPAFAYLREKESEAGIQDFAARVELGADLGLKRDGKTAKLTTPETRAAYAIWEQVNFDIQRGGCIPELSRDALRELPPFSREKSALKAWWTVAQKYIPHLYGEKFEKHPAFADWIKAAQLNAKKLRGEKKPSDIRHEIKKKIRQSLASLAE